MVAVVVVADVPQSGSRALPSTLLPPPFGRQDQNRLPTEFLVREGHELGYLLVLPAVASLPLLLAPDMLPFATALTCPPSASTQSRFGSPTAGSGAKGDRGRQVKLRVRSRGGWSRCRGGLSRSPSMSSRLSRL